VVRHGGDQGDDDDDEAAVWPTPEDFRTQLARRLSERLDEVIGQAIVAVRERISDYSGPAVTNLRAATETTAEVLLSVVGGNREATAEELARVEDAGSRLLSDGADLRAVEGALEIVAGTLYDDASLLAASIAPTPEVGRDTALVERVIRDVTLTGQALFGRLAVACIAVRNRGERARGSEQEAQFLDALLLGEFADDAEAMAAAAEAGVAISLPCAVVAIAPLEGGARHLRDHLAGLRPVLDDGLIGATVQDPYPHVAGVVAYDTTTWSALTSALDEAAAEAGVFVVATPSGSLTEVARCYRGIRRRLSAGAIVGWAGCLTPFNLTLAWLASMTTPEERFLDVAEVLGPCLARRSDWARKSIETLRALRDTRGERKEAARRLGITDSALNRRIRVIEEQLGLRFDNAMDLVALGLTISLYWADPDSLPPPGDRAWKAALALLARPEGTDGAEDGLHLVPPDGSGRVWPTRRRAYLRIISDGSDANVRR
jgi:hypothetical protein